MTMATIKSLACICMGISWLLSGLAINVAQLVLWITIRPLNKGLYRTVNYYVTYSMWSQLVAIAEWFSGSRVRVSFKDEKTRDMFGKEHVICLANHTYEVDWLFLWLLLDKYTMLANAKAMAKKAIKWLPVMGWCWYFNEFVFLARDWEQDKLIMGRCLDTFMQYKDKTMVLLFCEGTRFTKDKYKASVEFAASKGTKPYKHHLIPRARGFNYSIRHLKDTLPAVYNIQIAFSPKLNSGREVSFISIIRGEPLIGDVYVERIAVQDIDTSSDATTTAFLMDLYREKDRLMDHHLDKGCFPGIMYTPGPRVASLLNLILWQTVANSSLIYWLVTSFLHGNVGQFTAILGLWLSGFAAFFLLVQNTISQQGSSYGSSPAKTATTPTTPMTPTNGSQNHEPSASSASSSSSSMAGISQQGDLLTVNQ